MVDEVLAYMLKLVLVVRLRFLFTSGLKLGRVFHDLWRLLEHLRLLILLLLQDLLVHLIIHLVLLDRFQLALAHHVTETVH